MEASKQSWLSVIRTAGMRRRFLVTVFIGLFTQLSGNTLMSYYSGKLFELMGYTSDYTKTRINLAFACWSLMNATALALIVPRFKRRHMYMLSATLMLLVFIAITVSLQQIQATPVGQKNNAAGIAALFFYFAYSPTYNIGNNALTYSKSSKSQILQPLTLSSLPCRTLALCYAISWYWCSANLWKARRLLLHQRQLHCSRCDQVEVPGYLLWLDRLRVSHHLLALPRDQRPHPRGTYFPYVFQFFDWFNS